MLKNAFKKHPLQNRTNVQIKGGGVKGLLNNVQKNCTFLTGRLPLCMPLQTILLFSTISNKGIRCAPTSLPSCLVFKILEQLCWTGTAMKKSSHL